MIGIYSDESEIEMKGKLEDPSDEDLNRFQDLFESATTGGYVARILTDDTEIYVLSVQSPMCEDGKLRYHEPSSPDPPEKGPIEIVNIRQLKFEL